MVNGAFAFLAGPGDLGFQRGDPLLKLLDRQRIEILAGERLQRIIGAARKIVCVHRRES